MILLTGSTGALGSQLAHHLVSRGIKVRALIRPGADPRLIPESIRHRMEWSEGTLFDSYALNQALEGVDEIIHSAAVVSFAPARVKEMFRVNVEGTRTLVNEALEAGVKRFVHISSVAALGRPADKQSIDEEDLWVESENNTHYAKSKYLAELEVFRGFEEGLQGFVLNPSVILSPGDWNKSSTKLFAYVRDGGRYYTQGNLNYVDVRDVCNILSTLRDRDIQGERFVLNAGSVPYRYFFECVARELGKRPPDRLAGQWIKEFLWRLEHLRSLVTGSEPLITRETARLAGKGHTFSSHKIKGLLDYQFHRLEDSVHWVCQELAHR